MAAVAVVVSEMTDRPSRTVGLKAVALQRARSSMQMHTRSQLFYVVGTVCFFKMDFTFDIVLSKTLEAIAETPVSFPLLLLGFFLSLSFAEGAS